jgi:hypothetical protein
MRRACLFCPKTDLTKEHIWPDWIVTEFKQQRPPLRGRDHVEEILQDGSTRSRPGTLEVTRRIVCMQCNSEWMSQVEHLAKPILMPLIRDQGAPLAFSDEDICTLTTWVTLRSMVFDGCSEPGERYYTPFERASFAKSPTMAPPKHTHIWLGLYVGELHGAMFSMSNQLSKFTKKKGLHVVTIVVNRLAIKFATWKGHERQFDDLALRVWQPFTKRIWPNEGACVDWPPSRYIPRSSIDAFESWLSPRDPTKTKAANLGLT